MGAIQFFSPTSGIGITAGQFPCFTHSSVGSEAILRSQPVFVAVTRDGGRWWRLVGHAARIGPVREGPVIEQLVATSRSELWALVGSGHVVETDDGGQHWEVSTIAGPAVEITRGGAYVWALSCPAVSSSTSPSACRPQLWRSGIGTRAWAQVALPDITAQAPEFVDLAISPDGDMMLNVFTAGRTVNGTQLISTEAGRRWRKRPDPRWDRQPCTFGGLQTAAAPHTFWLLCIVGAEAGSSTKGLLRTTNAGIRWTTVSAAPSLTPPPAPESITLEEPSALAAGSANRLWLALVNGLQESENGGRSWSMTPPAAIDPNGWMSTISVLDARHAWVLAPGAGLWRTTDGHDWQTIGALNTGFSVAQGSAASTGSRPDLTVRRCLLSGLRLSVASQADSGTGEHDDLIVITNATDTRCRMAGYPHIALETDRGPLSFVYADGGWPYVTTSKPRSVILVDRQSAYFLVAKYRCDIGSLATANRVRVSLPHITWSAILQLTRPGVHQLDYCRCYQADQRIDPGNRITVSPIEPSVAAALARPRS